MIRKIRRTHKIVWLILAIALPLLFVAGIALRHRETFNENVPVRVSPRRIQRTQK